MTWETHDVIVLLGAALSAGGLLAKVTHLAAQMKELQRNRDVVGARLRRLEDDRLLRRATAARGNPVLQGMESDERSSNHGDDDDT